MPFTLYDATVPSYLQTLGAIQGLLAKAEAHCADKGVEPVALIQSRLTTDMLPFGYQVKSTVAHSIGSIRGVQAGVFSPDMRPWPEAFSELAEAVTSAVEALTAVTAGDIDEFADRDMRFEMGAMQLPFTGAGFLLSFSLPNFYFHATTAYDILRAQGVELGKRDYLGAVRIKTS